MLCFFTKKQNNINLNQNNQMCVSSSISKRDSIAVSSEYSELKYWFSELIKYIIKEYDKYENKEELLETVWKYINIIEVSKNYNIYKTKYSGEYSRKNMLEYCNFLKNTDFEKEIFSIEYVYRIH